MYSSHNNLFTILQLPEELLVIFLQCIDVRNLFLNISSTNQKFSRLTADKYVQHHLKIKFSDLIYDNKYKDTKRIKRFFFTSIRYILPNKEEYYKSLNYKLNKYRSILINYINDKHSSIFNLAALNKVREVYLIKNIININEQEESDETILSIALCNGHINIVKLLLKNSNLNVNNKNILGNTPIILAVHYGNLDIIKLLLERSDIDVNATNERNETALFVAVDHAKFEYVEVLLKHPNINVNIQNINGESAFLQSILVGYNNITNIIIKRSDIDVNIKNNDGNTALMLLMYMDISKDIPNSTKANNLKFINMMLRKPNIDINLKNNKGDTATMIATKNNKFKILCECFNINLIKLSKNLSNNYLL